MNKLTYSGPPPVGSGQTLTRSARLVLVCLAETIGTFMLGAGWNGLGYSRVLGKATAGSTYNSLIVALSFGLVLAPIVGSLGQMSGKYLNPAVNSSFAVASKMS